MSRSRLQSPADAKDFVAVVPPEARELLTRFDARSAHYDIAMGAPPE